MRHKFVYRPQVAEFFLKGSSSRMTRRYSLLIHSCQKTQKATPKFLQQQPSKAMALSCCMLGAARAAASPSLPAPAALLRRRHCPLAAAVGPFPHAQRWRRGLRFRCASSPSASPPPPPPVPPEEIDDYEVRPLLQFFSSWVWVSSSF